MFDTGPALVRRSISLSSRGAGVAVGWLEDNFHHFGVTIRHDGQHVTGIGAATVRIPWTTCGEAGRPLDGLVGQGLLSRASQLARNVPMQMHCTHLFELAALTMVHAAAGRGNRLYELAIRRDPQRAESMIGQLRQDGAPVMAWSVTDMHITKPFANTGQSLVAGFREWLESLDDEEADRAWMLRRGFWLAAGLGAFEPKGIASEMGLGPVCHTYQPEQRDRAYAIRHSQIDVNDPAIVLLSRSDSTP